MVSSFSGFEDNYSVMRFTNGQGCWQGPARSLKVRSTLQPTHPKSQWHTNGDPTSPTNVTDSMPCPTPTCWCRYADRAPQLVYCLSLPPVPARGSHSILHAVESGVRHGECGIQRDRALQVRLRRHLLHAGRLRPPPRAGPEPGHGGCGGEGVGSTMRGFWETNEGTTGSLFAQAALYGLRNKKQ